MEETEISQRAIGLMSIFIDNGFWCELLTLYFLEEVYDFVGGKLKQDEQ